LFETNAEILNRIKVEGAPLANKGSIYVKDSFTLAITPFEKEVHSSCRHA
jgi:ribosome recycling factor